MIHRVAITIGFALLAGLFAIGLPFAMNVA